MDLLFNFEFSKYPDPSITPANQGKNLESFFSKFKLSIEVEE